MVHEPSEAGSTSPGPKGVCPFCLRAGTDEGCFVLHGKHEHAVCRNCWERILLRPLAEAVYPIGPAPTPAGTRVP